MQSKKRGSRRSDRENSQADPREEEKEGKTNGVHTLYRSHPNHLFIDHHINLGFMLSVSLSPCQPCQLLHILLSPLSTHCTAMRINNAVMLTSTEMDW